jgi:regulator of protease activity HflC (stomatin/prohibitin superfamily)
MPVDFAAYILLAALVIVVIGSAIKIMREYERAVVFTLGRFTGVKGPGLIIIIPFVQQIVRVDLRTITLDVPSQDVISRDNVSVKVNAVIYFRVIDPDRSIIQVENFMIATSELAQTTLRSVLGKHDLDEMLAERDKLNEDIQEILDKQTDAWGIKVANVEIKHVDIDESMVRAIARQAEAERNRRARIINAEGEFQAAEKLVDAAKMLGTAPQAMQLRLLNTLYDIAGDKNSTIVFPIPIDMLKGMLGNGGGGPFVMDGDQTAQAASALAAAQGGPGSGGASQDSQADATTSKKGG